MGFVLEAEAFQTEYAAFEEFDADESVLEFYPQPCKLRLQYVNAKGKRVYPDTTPDIFCIRKDSFELIECKTEEMLLELAKAQPNRYSVDAEGRWRSPPAEDAAAKIGCKFILRSTRDNNWTLIENLDFLRDYLSVPSEKLKITPGAEAHIKRLLAGASWITISDLINGEPPIDSDSIYALIADKKIHFDLFTYRLSAPDQALIFRDSMSARAYGLAARISVGLRTPTVKSISPIVGTRFQWDAKPWRIINVGETEISALPLSGGIQSIISLPIDDWLELARSGRVIPSDPTEAPYITDAQSILLRASSAKLETAIWRREVLLGTPSDKNPLIGASKRTKAYWLSRYRGAEIESGIGLIGLIPNRDNTQGNHEPKADPQAVEEAISAYTEYWEDQARRSAILCHGLYVNDCEKKGITPIGYRSFRKIIAKRISYLQRKKRVGEKAAYDDAPPYLELDYTTPRHGNRPFQYGHIDHTPLPIKIRDKSGKYLLTTIWLTLLLDAYSRYVLAFYLSFDSPSYASCMMVIRECIKRHGRIPLWIIVDKGADFMSIYFETLLGKLSSHKKERPAGKPKFGSVIERIFRTTIDQFVSTLMGATHDENPRKTGRDIDPKNHAAWTFERLCVRLEQYLSTAYHTAQHGTLGQSPGEAFVNGLHIFGSRPNTYFAYTEKLLILTCPSTHKGTAKVQSKGVKINYLYYRCAAMDIPGVLRSRVNVRYDPFNVGIAYVYIRDTWHKCYSEYHGQLENYTEKQIRIASNHIRLAARLAGKTASINAQTLASFLKSVMAEEVLGMQRLHDAESKNHKSQINSIQKTDETPYLEHTPGSAESQGTSFSRMENPTRLEDF